MKNASSLSLSAWVLIAVLTVTGTAGAAEKPWALRDHYRLDFGQSSFYYDVQTSEWRITAGGSPVFDRVLSEVVLGDGTTHRIGDLTFDRDERENFADSLGSGSAFRSVYKTKAGLSVRYSLLQYKGRPFLLLQIDVRNDGPKALEIAAIRPAVFDKKSATAIARRGRAGDSLGGQRGGLPLPHGDVAPAFLHLHMRSENAAIGLGMLPSGSAEASVRIARGGDAWTGTAGVNFDPTITLRPGEAISADPLWISLGTDVATVSRFYRWSRSVLPTARRAPALPSSWATIESGQPIEVLYENARQWRRNHVNHALVPVGWETAPGTMRARVPLYPADMSEVAARLKGMGMTAGIAYDPLRVGNDKGKHILRDASGAGWVLPTDEKSAAFAIKRVADLARWGYQFFVVEASEIPDGILKGANLTRLEADMLAFRVLAEASQGRPVIPSPATTLSHELERWRALAGTTRGLTEYGLVAGPVRLLPTGIDNVPDDALAALASYAGPVEVVGLPTARFQRQLSAVFKEPAWVAELAAFRQPAAEAAKPKRRTR